MVVLLFYAVILYFPTLSVIVLHLIYFFFSLPFFFLLLFFVYFPFLFIQRQGPSSEERKAEAFRNESDALMENPIPLLLRRAGDNEASSKRRKQLEREAKMFRNRADNRRKDSRKIVKTKDYWKTMQEK